MEDLISWMTFGFTSFYFAGSFIGFKGMNLKYIALLGLGFGCLRECTGHSLLELLMKFIYK